MHSLKLFMTSLIFLILVQNIQSKVVTELNSDSNRLLPTALVLTKNDKYLASLQDEWQQVKISIDIAWNHVKAVANNTKTAIKNWMAIVKKRAQEISKAFEEKLNILKLKLHDVINKIFGDGEIVKECIKQEANEIKNLLNDIIQRMSSCLRNNMGSHSILRTGEEPIQLNETKFMERFEEEIRVCEKNVQNEENCLSKIMEGTVNEIQKLETNLYSLIKSRTNVDNLLDALVTCSVDGLIEASSIVATEALKITECVIEGSQKKTEIIKGKEIV